MVFYLGFNIAILPVSDRKTNDKMFPFQRVTAENAERPDEPAFLLMFLRVNALNNALVIYCAKQSGAY